MRLQKRFLSDCWQPVDSVLTSNRTPVSFNIGSGRGESLSGAVRVAARRRMGEDNKGQGDLDLPTTTTI